MPKDKILILSTSVFTDRIFLHSSFIQSIKNHADINIIAKSYNVNKNAWDKLGIPVFQFPQLIPLRHFTSYLRRINEFTWMYELDAQSLKINEKYTEKQSKLRNFLKFLGWVLSKFKVAEFLDKIIITIIHKSYKSRPEIESLFEKIKPNFVLISNPFWVEEPLFALEANLNSIPVISIIPSWDNITTKSRIIFKVDAFGVWSNVRLRELEKYYPASIGKPNFIYGTPQYDVFKNEEFFLDRDAFINSHSLEKHLPIILYTLGSPLFIHSEIEVCLTFCEQAKKTGLLNSFQILIRPHPIKDFTSFINQFEGIHPNIHIQRKVQTPHSVEFRFQDDEMIKDWVNTFRHAELVIATSSTTLLDAAMFNKKHINIAANLAMDPKLNAFINDVSFGFEHLKSIQDEKIVFNIFSMKELTDTLHQYLKNPNIIPDYSERLVNFLAGYSNSGNYGKYFSEQLQQTLLQINNKLNA